MANGAYWALSERLTCIEVSSPSTRARGIHCGPLTPSLTSAKFNCHEPNESFAPATKFKSTAVVNDSAIYVLVQDRALAFCTGLGAPLLALVHSHSSHEDVKAFTQEGFAKGNVVFFGTGISQEKLT
jgi:ubiquinol-cytochrome c reductase core subunit 2